MIQCKNCGSKNVNVKIDIKDENYTEYLCLDCNYDWSFLIIIL